MTKEFKTWAVTRLERFAIFVCTIAISIFSWALWENYKFNQSAMVVIEQNRSDIARHDQELAEIRGQMLTWDMLKRIELMLSAFPETQRGLMINKALRMELEGRKEGRK